MLSIAGWIVTPTTGFASYAGQHMWQGDGDPRHEVAFVLQVYGLVPILSARENVAIALELRLERTPAARATRRRGARRPRRPRSARSAPP